MTELSEKLSPEVVVVTGSSGLIGSAVVRAIVSRYQAIGFDRIVEQVGKIERRLGIYELDQFAPDTTEPGK